MRTFYILSKIHIEPNHVFEIDCIADFERDYESLTVSLTQNVNLET